MVPFQPSIQHVPPMSTLLPNPLWVPALFTPSTVGSSHTRLSNTCAAPAPTRLWTPPFAYGLPIFIYLFIYYYFIVSSHHTVGAPSLRSGAPPLLTVGLLPFSLWAPLLLTVSLGSSLPQHGALSHRTQVRGSSMGVLSLLLRGLSSILVAWLSPFLSGGSPSLPGAHPHLVHSTVGLPHISVGLLHIAVGLFTISSWGFVSLWGSSPSRSLNCGASPHLCGALPHLAHSTVGPTHICVGLFTIFPWVFISLWGSSPSRSLNCGASPHLSVGLFPLSPWSFLSLRGSSLSRSLNCTLTQLWHSTGSCILLLAPSSRGGGGGLLPPPLTHLIFPFPTWGSLG